MNTRFKPRRATCIVGCDDGILLAETSGGLLLLPGGQANRGESRLEAAIRELREETTLQAHAAIYLFDHESFSNRHKVFYLLATGTPKPQDDAVALHYTNTLSAEQQATLSPATIEILRRFNDVKKEHEHQFAMLKVICLKEKLAI